jgi:hypothetical protein
MSKLALQLVRRGADLIHDLGYVPHRRHDLVQVLPASSTSLVPLSTFATESDISRTI